MTEQQQPYLGQRCAAFADRPHQEMHGFGTIIALKVDPVSGKQLARVELDARGSHWYDVVEQLELLPTYPAV